jgi:pyrimidine-nucleoside phosphorylase
VLVEKSKEDKIDYSVGIKLNKNVGDIITKGQVLATIYYNSDYTMNDVDNYFTIK